MRVSNHAARRLLGLAIAATLVVACGSAVPSSLAPSVRPTPMITPDPHLTEPATADEVFTAIRSGGLPLAINNATAGDLNSPLVKRINADIANWPLVITEFRSSTALRDAVGWDAAVPPAQGDPPYAFVGLNILVEFGPVTGPLATPDAPRRDQAKRLIALIDPLLWPLEQRSVVVIATRTPTAPPAPAASSGSAAPSAAASPEL
jgi:hypothetical protein